MPDLHIDAVSFAYTDTPKLALSNINLTIPTGEFVLLAGPSGCGKSTLALAIAGLIPTRITGDMQGNIYLDEKNINAMDVQEVAQSVGMVFQNPDNQLVHLDVESEVAFGPENLALPHDEVETRVSDALSYTGMESMRFQEIFALSGGQKQRVAISATLAMRPKILVLDEPTSDLDPVGTQEVLSVLRTLNRQYGMTIVLVEHKIDEVVPWVDRVLLMEEGRLLLDASPRHVFDDIAVWQRLGVSVPQVVLLAHELPDVFTSQTPLSVDEVYNALRGTPYALALQQHNERLGDIMQSVLHDTPLVPAGVQETPQQSILSWESVALAYDTKQVLKNVQLQVMPEEWVALVGPNGSGKTSLASLAMGFQAPTSGSVCYRGRPVEVGQISRQAERMAYLFQAADNMLFEATVEREFLFGVRNRRKRKEALPFSVDELLAIVDLTAYRKDNPFNLSFGQRKRLAIGVLLTRHPDMLILDEPTTGQDEGHARAFLEFLQRLREHDKFTYLMITHDMQAVAQYASRVVVLRDGHIVLNGPPSMVFAHMDELALCGVLPPPIAQLHARLCNGKAVRVALDVPTFLQVLRSVEVRL
jgi:energy-coupling factor transport system ATP-binding protein